MKSNKTLAVFSGLSVFVLLLSLAWVPSGDAHDRHHHGKGHWERKHDDCRDEKCKKGGFLGDVCKKLPCPYGLLDKKDELGLDDSQVAKLKKLKSDSKKAKIRKKADLKILKVELKDLLDGKTIDKAAVEAKIEEIGKQRTLLTKDCINTGLTAKEILTDEQLAKWKALKKSCPTRDRFEEKKEDRD